MLWNRSKAIEDTVFLLPLSVGASFVITLSCVKRQLPVKGIPGSRIHPDSCFSKF